MSKICKAALLQCLRGSARKLNLVAELDNLHFWEWLEAFWDSKLVKRYDLNERSMRNGPTYYVTFVLQWRVISYAKLIFGSVQPSTVVEIELELEPSHTFDRSNKNGHRLTHRRINSNSSPISKSGTRFDTQPDSVASDMTRVVSWLRNIEDDRLLYPSKS